MDKNTNYLELIEALKNEHFVYSGHEINRIDRTTYQFIVLFRNGQVFEVVCTNADEIRTLTDLIQIHLKQHFSKTSAFKDLLTLEAGKRYTLLVMSGLGIGAHAIHITMEKAKVGKYAQYDDSVELIFKPKGKRNLRAMQFYGRQEFVVWENWIDLNTEAFTQGKERPFVIVKRSKYASFDKRYLTDAIASTPIKPLYTKLFN